MRLTTCLAGAVLATALVAPSSGMTRAAAEEEVPAFAAFDARGPTLRGTARLDRGGARTLQAVEWTGGSYVVSGGERVTVYISPAYGDDPTMGRRWADFLGSLVHGSELALLTAYVASIAEVEEICGGRQNVFGCYFGQRLVTVGDSSAGVSPESVAAHEYGHHVAANRINAPWIALDWGTKRWASQTGICSRVQAGTVFPGDEGVNYSFNPGEAFAESYRVLIETKGSAVGYDWPIVDPSFRPDPRSLDAVREDVLHPWAGSSTKTIAGKFLRRSRTWTTRVATPLDGDLRIRVTVPGGGANDVALLSSDGRTGLAKSSWDSSGAKSIEYRVCGVRSVRVRVIRGGRPARFSLRVTAP